MSEVLVSWIGNTDLRSVEPTAKDGPGPIRETLKAYSFTKVVLLSNFKKAPEIEQVQRFHDCVIAESGASVALSSTDLASPVHFGDIHDAANEVLETLTAEGTTPSILITPGTPAMQAVWILLSKSRFNCKLLTSSKEQGVLEADIPFDIDATFRARIGDTRDYISEWAKRPAPDSGGFEEITTANSEVEFTKKKAAELAKYDDVPVLILGETGTGKELFAHAIHNNSRRSDKPFIVVNCGAISENLIDSELFGFKAGAFTGANKNRNGKIKEADGGTLFLDEFGELTLEAQVRLLRVLQQGEITPLGTAEPETVDVRIITATNKDLPSMIASGEFREDLYYRVAMGILKLPALRDRGGDLQLLTDEFMGHINSELQVNESYKSRKLSTGAKRVIKNHNWPGNIRELYSALKAACLWSVEATISESVMRDAIPQPAQKPDALLPDSIPDGFSLGEFQDKIRSHYVGLALRAHGTNKAAAARSISVSPQLFGNWLKDMRGQHKR